MSPFRARVRSRLVISIVVLFVIGISANAGRLLLRRAPNLNVARSAHAAAPLRGGELLIVGGSNGSAPIAESEIFSLSDGTMHPGPRAIYARAEHTATALRDGNVLVAGGRDAAMLLDTAEVYDARTHAFALAGRMTTPRAGHTATLLADNRVLVAGNGSAEVFDPETREFSAIEARMSVARSGHSAVLLADGRVLIAGGRDAKDKALDSAEVFDGTSFTAIGSMSVARVRPTLRPLPDGKVQVIGGDKNGTMEIFDPSRDAFTAKAVIDRANHPTPQARLAIIDAAIEPLDTELRHGATITKVDNATVITGGASRDGMTSEVTVVPDRAWVTTKSSEVEAGKNVEIAAGGFEPGESVSLVLEHNADGTPWKTIDLVADADGNVAAIEKVAKDAKDETMTATATGATSKYVTMSSWRVAPAVSGSTLTSVTTGAQTPNPVAKGNSATYLITVNRSDNGSSSTALSVTTALPTGVTASFSPASISFSGNTPSGTSTLTLATTASTPTGTTTFNVRAVDSNTVNDGTPQLVVASCTAAAVTAPPTNQAVTYNGNATFSATGTGGATLSAQWQVSTDGGANFTNTGSSTSGASPLASSLTVTAPKVSQSGNKYRVVYSSTCGGGTTATSSSATLTVNPRALAVTATASNKVYDGTTAASVTTADNRVSGDVFTVNFTSAIFANKNVGTTKTVTVSGISLTGTDAANYTPNTSTTATADITARALTVSATASNKTYNGNTTASVTLSDNRVAGDVLTTSFTSATFANKNVGTAKTVTVSGISISGTDSGNYTFNTSTIASADITARALAVTATASNKTYDGNTTASVTLSDNRVAGDVLTTSFTSATFANKNVGTAKTVTVSGISISGTDSGNYTFNTSTTASADITTRTLAVTATASNKVYDGLTSASVTTADNRVSGDVFTVNFTSATFATKTVGTAKTVTVSGISLSGTDSGNYTCNTSTTASADITARPLTVSATASNKTYDGTTAASVTLSDNRVAGDVFTDSFTSATFADKNKGNAKVVTVSGISISGADAGNYTFNTSTTTTADITARTLTVTATGIDKTYDGTAAATVTLSNDRVSGDAVTNAYTSATFPDKNVGTNRTVSVSGITISGGADANNYVLGNTTATTTANINKATVVPHITADDKTYDGTTDATIATRTLTGVISPDVVALTGGTASFDTKHAGSNKNVTGSGFSLSGGDAGNYDLNPTTATTTATINTRTLAVTAHASNKTYDGNANASVTFTDDRLAGDVVTYSYTTALFNNKNAGSGKLVTVSGLSITGGSEGGDYTLASSTVTTNADINARSLTVTATASNKVYDGNTNASVTLSDDRVSGDVLTIGYTSALFDTKHALTGKTVTVSGISITGGADQNNYTLANATATATADITKRDLNVTATANNKTYDGNTTASVALFDDRVSGDSVTLGYTSATFDTKHAGTGKTVTVSGISITGGADGGDYSLVNSSTTTTADITKRDLNVSAFASNKVYDGNTNASVTLSDDRVSGDSVTLGYTSATFDDKNAGSGKTVTVSGISITGGAEQNDYALVSTTATALADITKRDLNVTATASNKTYDGNATATVTLLDDRVSGDDVVLTYADAEFDTKDVGTAKNVTVTGIAIDSGADKDNYSLVNTTATATADITMRTLTATATASNKTYDGNTNAGVTLSDDRVNGDNVSVTYTGATFDTKNAGNGKTVTVSGIAISGADSGNYSLFSTTATTTADITARSLTVTATASNKVYDGNANASATLHDDRVSGDVITLGFTSATFDTKHVGNGKLVTVSGISITGGADQFNYTLANTSATANADITKRDLHVTATASNKVYDGNTTASVTLADDRVSGDDVTVGYTSATFDTKNVGSGKVVTVSGISITGGADGGDYLLFNTTTTANADITARSLTVGAMASSKIYDGNANASVTLTDDRVSGDSLTLGFTSATFFNKNVGASKSVTVSGISITGGSDSGNYVLFNTTAFATADITARTVSPNVTVSNKVYDQTTAATILTRTLNNAVGGDDVQLTGGTATFNNKNAGTNKLVTITGLTLSGAEVPNYILSPTSATTMANITPATATPVVTVFDKIYDGTTAATINTRSLTGVYAGDNVTLNGGTATFNNKNVGTNKLVTITGLTITDMSVTSIGDLHAYVAPVGNYVLSSTSTTANASITPRTLNVTAIGNNKVYDGTTAATVSFTDDRVSGDVLTVNYTSATFSDKSVGNGKSISVTGISLSGTDSGNYTVSGTASATANITARALHVTATGINKVYDGNANATVTLSDDRVSGDDVTVAYTSATFNNKHVGTGKFVTVTGISITGGADSGNYSLFNTSTLTTADVTKRDLHVTATASNKTYDGNANASATLSDDRVPFDDVTVGYTSATFSDKNVGSGKTVTVSGISITGGADQNDYLLFNTSTTATADITQRTLNVTATGVNKIYDGTATATVTLSDDRVSGDLLTLGYTAANFNNKNVGTSKLIMVTGISITGGADSGNYFVGNPTTTATADITTRTVSPNVTVSDKVYDQTTAATIATRTLTNAILGDDVQLTGGTATFNDKNAGINKPVNVTGLTLGGTDASNYYLSPTSASTTASITPATVTPVVTVYDKIYDGTTAATINTRSLTGVYAGDNVTLTGGTATFADKNVGNGKTVTITGLSLNDLSASSIGRVRTMVFSVGNYVLSSTSTTALASITPRTLNVTAIGQSKVYDGTNAATVTFTDDRVSGDVLTVNYTSATFNNKSANTAKPITVNGLSLSGPDANNYTLGATISASASADITVLTVSPVVTILDKTYDRTTAATINTRSLTGAIPGDFVSLSGGTATFTSATAGPTKSVNITGLSLSGIDSTNYILSSTSTTATAAINPKSVTPTVTVFNKSFDGNTTATINTRSLSGVIAPDVVNLTGGVATFSDSAIGTNKLVTITGLTLGGADAGNYVLSSTSTTAYADITGTILTVTATAQNKVYDGNTNATVTLSDNRAPGANITVNYTSATFNNKNAGNGKTVTVSGLSISGPDSGGYQLASPSITTTANITPAPLTVIAQNASRQYSDPNPSFNVTYSGFVGGDTASSLSSPPVCTSAAALSTPGTYPITCGSAGASNYSITYFSGTLTVTAEDARVFYTGLTSASTSSPTSSTATLTLAATVKDITAFLLDGQYDPDAGVISNARVTFRDVVRNTTLCTANVGLDGTDQKVGTATCNASVNIGSGTSATYTVGLVVGSYYIRNNAADNVTVTVSKATNHPITGTGTLTLVSSGGTKAGDAGSTTNFTFNAQYSGSAITGSFDILYKRTESSVLRTYEIKGTSLNELLTGGGKASFNATSVTVLDVTNPTPVTLDSNATVTITFTDNGLSGDTIGITALNKFGGIWFSSKFDGTTTVEQVVATGDCVIN